MKELTQSLFSYSLAVTFFGLKQIDSAMSSGSRTGVNAPAVRSLDTMTSVTTAEFGEALADTFHAVDRLQRGMVGLLFEVVLPYMASAMKKQFPGETRVILMPGAESEEPHRHSETIWVSGRD